MLIVLLKDLNAKKYFNANIDVFTIRFRLFTKNFRHDNLNRHNIALVREAILYFKKER
jgi:hypothetical protein